MLLAATACNKEIQGDNPTPEAKPQVELSFNASLTVPTKTEIGVVGDKVDGVAEHQIYWSKGDKIKVYPHGEGFNEGPGVEFESDDLSDSHSATAVFKGEVSQAEAYYAFYPVTSGAKWLITNKIFSVVLPDNQKANGIASGFAAANVTDKDEVTFDHVCGFVKFTIDEEYAGKIKEVRLSGNNSEALAGRLNIFPDDMTKNKIAGSPTDMLVLTPSESESFDKGTYYFTSFPVTLSDGITLDFVNLEDQVATKSSSGEASIERAGILNLGTVSNLDFEVVTPTIPDGTYVILAKQNDVYYAMGSTHNANASRLDETEFDNAATETHLNSLVWTFTNVSGSTYSVTNGGKHLVASSSNDASLSEEGSPLTVTANEDGTYCIAVAVNDVTRYLSRNDVNKGFAFYGNTGQNEMLYLKSISYVEKPELDAPVISSAEGNNEYKTITVEWTDVDNATSYEIVCGDQSETVDAGVQTCTFTMTEYGTYKVTVTANADGYVSATSEMSEVTLLADNEKVITLDLSKNIFDLSTSKANDASDEIVKTFEGLSYNLKASESCYYFNNKALMLGKKNSYITFPAIESYKLSSIEAYNCAGASSKVTLAVCPLESTTPIEGGAASTITPGESTTWSNLATVANTSYRLYVTNANAVQFTKIVLTYTK